MWGLVDMKKTLISLLCFLLFPISITNGATNQDDESQIDFGISVSPGMGVAFGFGGVDIPTGNLNWLRLDATNDPMTGDLDMGANSIHGADNAVVDASSADNLTLRGGNKTASTGNGGHTDLIGGSSVGGTKGNVRIPEGEFFQFPAAGGGNVHVTNDWNGLLGEPFLIQGEAGSGTFVALQTEGTPTNSNTIISFYPTMDASFVNYASSFIGFAPGINATHFIWRADSGGTGVEMGFRLFATEPGTGELTIDPEGATGGDVLVKGGNPVSKKGGDFVAVGGIPTGAGNHDGGDIRFVPGTGIGSGESGTIQFDGRMASITSQENIIADNTTLVLATTNVILTSNTAVATDRTIILPDGIKSGQFLLLVFVDATDALELLDDDTQFCGSADWTPDDRDTLSLRWFNTASCWYEVSRSAN